MSVSANLSIDNKTFKVLHFHLEQTKRIDNNGRIAMHQPSLSSNILLTLESDLKDNFKDWMTDNIIKSGIITFFNPDDLSPYKKIEFADARCLSCNEDTPQNDTELKTIEISISSTKVRYQDCTILNN